ncbi:MAG TPA: hypothetical protein VK183_03330 [Flavobacterium sp.]|nr:hypothetical protein [Flavobacterium sp.]
MIEGKQVSSETFPGLIAKNPRIVVYNNGKEIIGIGALKIPSEGYKSGVFNKAKSDENPGAFKFELGWIVSLSKGIGSRLVEVLVSTNENLYATTRVENNKMISILLNHGFIQNGNPYKSDVGDYSLKLYTKKTGL